MAISNTKIQIKRSSITATPTGLNAGELAYSFLSNTLFLGNTTGTGVVNIGGLYYTQAIDQATAANTANTLIKRAADGSFAGQLYGTANLAIATVSNNQFSISGGDISASAQYFQGNNNVTLNASLNSITGLAAGYYGSPTVIPTLQVGANGRILSITSNTISTTTYVSNGTIATALSGGNTFTILTGNGITTTVTANGGGANVYISHDNTVVRSNTTTNVGPVQTISTDLTIAGNLIVTGTQTFVNTSTVVTNDSLIKLAANNNTADIVDIGFYGQSNTGSSNVYHGIIREGSGGTNAGDFYVFKNLATDPTGNTVLYSGLTQANLRANIISNIANIVSLGISGTANIATLGVSGVANVSSLGVATNANIAGATITTANISNLGVSGTANLTTLGVSGVSNLASLGVSSANITGATIITANISNLGVSGVINTSSIGATTANISAITISGIANVTTLGVSGTANISVLGVTNAFNASSIGATTANIGSLTLTTALGVSSGGTGQSSFTTNGITYGNGTGPLQITAAAGTSDQTWSNQILTVTNAGVPVWSTIMDGGTF